MQAKSWSNCASRVYFLDQDGQEIDCFNPQNIARAGVILAIGDNEELIGVYGVKNKRPDVLTSFGFIVKVR